MLLGGRSLRMAWGRESFWWTADASMASALSPWSLLEPLRAEPWPWGRCRCLCLAVIQGPIGNHGQDLGCPGLLLGLLTTWKHLTFWVDIKKCENYTSKYLYMGFLLASAVNIWSNSMKLLLLLMDLGRLGQSEGPIGHLLGQWATSHN